jgi:hypothetical protein
MPPRNDIETTTECPTCRTAFTPIRRQHYCSPACRQAAWRARHTDPPPRPTIPIPTRMRRRDITIYECTECEQRYLAEQWCHDCNRPCTRIDFGGLCPHCDEPVTIKDLTDQHQRARSTPAAENE